MFRKIPHKIEKHFGKKAWKTDLQLKTFPKLRQVIPLESGFHHIKSQETNNLTKVQGIK